MARQYTGWLDDQGGTHDTQEAAEAADLAHIRKTARETIKKLIYQAIDWRDQKLDLDVLLANAGTIVANIEALIDTQPPARDLTGELAGVVG